jgi:hypothetical protein
MNEDAVRLTARKKKSRKKEDKKKRILNNCLIIPLPTIAVKMMNSCEKVTLPL